MSVFDKVRSQLGVFMNWASPSPVRDWAKGFHIRNSLRRFIQARLLVGSGLNSLVESPSCPTTT